MLVMLLHTLVLGALPSHVGLTLTSTSNQVTSMVTRRIAPPPTPAPLAIPKYSVQTAPLPVVKKKSVVIPAPAAKASFLDSVDANVLKTADSSAQLVSETEIVSAPPASAPAAILPAQPAQTLVTAITLPASTEMHYEVTGSAKGLTYYAKSELVWHHNDAGYEARMTVSALFLGSRSMTSQGGIGSQGLAPRRFSDKSKTEVAAHFEPDKSQVSFSANTPSVPWLEGVQDRVSVFIQLGGILAANSAAFPAGSHISVYTVGPRDADIWTFQVEGEETLILPWGNVMTIKLSRQLRDDYDQKLEVWYAPSLGYLPVRNKITKINGDFVDQQLKAVSGR